MEFTKGLNKEEIDDIEKIYKINFPPDYRELLMYTLPISNGFVNWRNKSKENIEKITHQMNWPLEGIIFDIEHNGFWVEGWGEKPSDLEDAINIATINYENVPKLIPIYGHRYIPSFPFEKGNPIMSVWQTDIIYYGKNLWDYFSVEFGFKQHHEIDFDNIKKIPFWYDIFMS
ncbi:SMI1/KNR4 family protein [Neobacillus sp. PS3-34]|uniref:SMI1/KNR4 family protein n=1 Tax=Neobacillus sp. PS3-34 TaxID=3070678 RepID=UPI0027E1DA23|nr:SMI1/KNR4 family protein [Neobacillus sp. PS3-34]WML48522.1 SMI1/KNR4 family protein [Neobacillus sp. PS3-34]